MASHSKEKPAQDRVPDEICALIEKSPSAYHVVKNAKEELDAELLFEGDAPWEIDTNKSYVATRNDSSVIFAHIPENIELSRARFEIAAVHSDSPGLFVKNAPSIVKDGYVSINVEEYGATIRSSWLDRPLSIAGRVCVREKEDGEEGTSADTKTYLVDLSDLLGCVIPSLAPHMGGEESKPSVQKEMLPIIGTESAFMFADTALEDAICRYLEQSYGLSCSISDILSHDLLVYNAQSPQKLGGGSADLICAPRVDDQGCVWASVKAFANVAESKGACNDVIAVLAIFDNEENGSSGYHAASSTFLDNFLFRIWEGLQAREDGDVLNANAGSSAFRAALSRSFVVSADNGHAAHPNHPDKSDPTNKVVCGGGIVVKSSADQKYMTSARSAASFMELCRDEEIPYQVFHKNSDVRGGQTLGNILATQVSVPGVDIGLPQLAMHSACETVSATDMRALYRFFCAYFSGKRAQETATSEIICY